MIFKQCSLIQEGESALFYRYDRTLNGYMIAGLFIAPNTAAKLSFVKLWKYFLSEVVRDGDMYCSVPLNIESSMFDNYLNFHSEIDGFTIYKIDNFLKEQYSMYTQHLKGTVDESE